MNTILNSAACDKTSLSQKIINSSAFAWVFSGIVLGSVGMYAWHVAYILHTTGSELIKLFIQ